MITIVALGNPEPEYAQTRHNVGREAIKIAFSNLDWSKDSRTKSLIATFPDENMVFLMPNNFMNRSGSSVKEFMKEKSIDDLIVVHDELDLPFGTIKVVKGKGAGGHNGVQSVIDHLGTNDFIRVRIGIGQEGIKTYETGADFVLGRFTEQEKEKLSGILLKVESIIKTIRDEGVAVAMNKFN